MDHNWTSLGSTIVGELKLAAQFPKVDMILVDKKIFQKVQYVQVGVDKTTIFTKNSNFSKFLNWTTIDFTGFYYKWRAETCHTAYQG